jgi:hypothetical protein
MVRKPSGLISRVCDPAQHQAALSGDHGHFAGKLLGFVGRDPAIAVRRRLQDLHAAGEQNEKMDDGVVGFEQDIAGSDRPHGTGTTKAGDLSLGQMRKHLGLRSRVRLELAM